MFARVTPILDCNRKRAACSSLMLVAASGGPAGAAFDAVVSSKLVLSPQALKEAARVVINADEVSDFVVRVSSVCALGMWVRMSPP